MLSPAQIYNAARQAGFGPARAVVATAVALAESGGNPKARCHDCFPGIHEDSRGLWQINVVAHPQMAAWNLYDPATNARAAYAISNGGRNFNPWSTYTNGAYSGKLRTVYDALGISRGALPPDAVPGADVPQIDGGSGPLGGIGVGAHDASWWKPWTWGSAIAGDAAKITLTAVFTIGGVALIVIGIREGVQPTIQRAVTAVATRGASEAAA